MADHPLLQRVQREGNPLIDGETVTFVWRGRQAPQLLSDFGDFEAERALPLEEVAPGLWAATTDVPRDAYIEYAWQRGDRRLSDPYNRRTTSNGLGARNHYFFMPEARPTPLARRRARVRAGRVTQHVVDTDEYAATATRAVWLYHPPVSEPCPLVVVFDGREYLQRVHLPVIVDNLIASGRMTPVALAMIANYPRARYVEYGASDTTLNFLVDTVLPLARHKLNLLDAGAVPGAYGALGASMGGVMALYAGLRLPQLFGHVLSQSGAFSLDGHDHVVYDLVRYGPVHPLRLWLDAGSFEDLRAGNERMRELLTVRGYDVTYREYHGGHNYPAWRDDVWRGLEVLFGRR